MKTTVSFNGKELEIELTESKIADLKKKSTVYTDIKTLQDALNYNGETLDEFNYRTQFDDDSQRAYKELEVIAKAIRQGNELGQKEGDMWYYPWFNSKRSSVGFSAYDCYYDRSVAVVGSRLCVENSEKAKYLGAQFLDTYDRYLNANELSKTDSENKVVDIKKFDSYRDIKTFENACQAVGVDVLEFQEKYKNLDKDTYAYEQLKIISKALNGGDHMNYDDTDEYKYYPWFNAVGSSVGFSYGVCTYDTSPATVGSRLTYKSSEIAEYAGRQFIDIYDKYIN